MIPPTFIVSNSDFQLRHISCLVSLCLLALEYMGTCRFEFTHIWRRPITTSKVTFLVARYYELIGKIIHYSLIHTILGRSPYGVSHTRCTIWYTLLSMQCTVMIICLDVILFLRVYALYQKRRPILLLGVPLIINWSIGLSLNLYLAMNHQQSKFDGLCNVRYEGVSRALATAFSGSFIVSHTLLCISAYMRRNVGHGHIPVVRLVVNEGAWVFVILIGIVAATAPVDVALEVFNPFFHYVCPPTLVSILTCRIIQNMHSLALTTELEGSARCDDDAFQLTTFIGTDMFSTGMEDVTA